MSNSKDSIASLDWIVLKLTQLCNLNCQYCYVYNRGSDLWKHLPQFLPMRLADVLGQRIESHCGKHEIRSFTIELHGGEPLLYGRDRLRELVQRVRGRAASVDINFCVQTNGLLLDLSWLQLFDELGITFGISMDFVDANAQIPDQRVFHSGRGSTDELVARIASLREESPLFDKLCSGALSVINPSASGRDAIRWLMASGFHSFSFLLPDGNYANRPHIDDAGALTRFLVEAFDEWYEMAPDVQPRIRLFEHFVMRFAGIPVEIDGLGGDLKALCVVNTDGAIEVNDVLSICGEASERYLNIETSELSAHAIEYGVDSLQELCTQCSECQFGHVCGGGYLPHRFDGSSFRNPSIHCETLFAFAGHVWGRLSADVPRNRVNLPIGS